MHALLRSPHARITQYYRPTASRSADPGSGGFCATCALFARPSMPCHGGPTVTPEKNRGWGARSGCFRATPGGAFRGCRPSRGQEGTPPVRPPARRFVLVVLGNGGADITGPSTRAAMIHGTAEPPWSPPDAIQAAHRQPAHPGKLRGLAPKNTPKTHSSKYLVDLLFVNLIVNRYENNHPMLLN